MCFYPNLTGVEIRSPVSIHISSNLVIKALNSSCSDILKGDPSPTTATLQDISEIGSVVASFSACNARVVN